LYITSLIELANLLAHQPKSNTHRDTREQR